MSWNLCLMRPDRVRALVNLSVAFMPRNPSVKPVDYFRRAYSDDYYVCRFQEPGFEAGFACFDLKRFFKMALTVQTTGSSAMSLTKMQASNKDITLTSWLSKEDVTYLASVYAKTGFAGGLKYYRFLDLNVELMAPHGLEQKCKCQPSLLSGRRPCLPSPRSQRLHAQWWAQERCASA